MPAWFKAEPERSIRLRDASWPGTGPSSLESHVSSDPYFSGRPVAATSALEDAPVLPEPPLTAVKPKPQHRRRTGPLRNAVEWILIIGVALLVAVVIKQFLVQAFYIPSESMKSSLNVGDRVLGARPVPQRGARGAGSRPPAGAPPGERGGVAGAPPPTSRA